jgi:two-component system, sensor histidine kinase PdtaS
MTEGQQRRLSSRLAFRFVVILALALLPAGFIGFVQTQSLSNEIQARSEVALFGATLQAAAPETGLIRGVRGMVATLSDAIPLVVDDLDACTKLMQAVAAEEPNASLVAFVPLTKIMSCNSRGTEFDLADNPYTQEILDAKAPHFVVNPNSTISNESVLGISHPVWDETGNYLGFAVISIAHQKLSDLRFEVLDSRSELQRPLVFWTFDSDGTILTSNVELAEASQHVPAFIPLKDFVDSESELVRLPAASGNDMTYAVAPIVPGSLYLMGSFLPESGGIWADSGLSLYLPTFLMWLVGLVASGFAAEMLVTRHIRTLNRSIVSFAGGDRRLRAIDLNGAPAELSELADAYLSMTESITRSEAELEDSVHQKEVLLREVHHRVKNNLQLISSIMNIQIRSAKSGEARDLLKNLQERVMSLATVHRGLYQTSGLADVRARELIPDIVRQILSMSQNPDRPFDSNVDIDDLRLVPDQAVPLSLLLSEALTNALKHAGASREQPGRLSVRLKRLGGSEAFLEVTNSKRTRPVTDLNLGAADTGIGSQLITAFIQQLGGRKDISEAEGTYGLKVTFAITPLSAAENRLDQKPFDPSVWNQTAP